ncbi:hypothetical protein LTR85_002152 [Meristemomyces frigidus]|nr:hypothetical protein LTR85_002152 [Meristemomyces frigidus]
MGLGAPKRRSKLSHDPNNTAWSKSTTSFGHRILSSQGWKPGDYLGAEDAAHGEHYTAANASHIRVLLREDNLGIGAKVGGKGNAETFGLSTLSGIFGRLNGKSDVEVQKQQSSLRDADLRMYQAQKFGYMNFVSGGLLVGDKIEELPDKALAATTVDGKAASADVEQKPSKKRKADGDDSEAVTAEKSANKKRKSGEEAASTHSVSADLAAGFTSESKDSRKKRKGKLPREEDNNASNVASESDAAEAASPDVREKEDKQAKRDRKERRRAERQARSSADDGPVSEKGRLKLEKRARKEERRRRKEEKRRLKAGASDSDESAAATVSVPVSKSDQADSSGTSTPIQASLVFGGSRHAVRQRYIMQKRMASMDPRALNEILMIKAQG